MGCCSSKVTQVAGETKDTGPGPGGAYSLSSVLNGGPGKDGLNAGQNGGPGSGTGFGAGGAGAGAGAGVGSGADSGAAGGAEPVSASAVKVAVVVRPMLPFEVSKAAKDVVILPNRTQITVPSRPGASDLGAPFDFDRVYRSDGTQQDNKLYTELAKPIVERFLQGFNATVMAYGQTGSGKTFTMGTAATPPPADDHAPVIASARGLIPHALAELFAYCTSAAPKYDIIVKMSYVEIYNEQIQDLLADAAGAGRSLEFREKPDGEVIVDGAVEVVIRSASEAAALLKKGNASRAVGAHNMNAQSSRSHAVVSMTLEQRCRPGAIATCPEKQRFLRSKLRLVDLAGSERAKDTGATGERFQEGVNINKGLLELGNVINALAEREAVGDARRHVPYRNSKLTRLLQESLGGNSETLFVACCSPADANLEQTINTLRYASRARSIRNAPRRGSAQSAEEELAYLRQMVQQLQRENEELRARLEARGRL